MPYTYMVQCADGSYYTGWALDVEKRVAMHNSGKGAKYTRARLPVTLVWQQYFAQKQEAQRLEVFIKGLSRKQKEAVVLHNTQFQLGER